MGEGSLEGPTSPWLLGVKEKVPTHVAPLSLTPLAEGQRLPPENRLGEEQRKCLLSSSWPWRALGHPAVTSCGQPLAGRLEPELALQRGKTGDS